MTRELTVKGVLLLRSPASNLLQQNNENIYKVKIVNGASRKLSLPPFKAAREGRSESSSQLHLDEMSRFSWIAIS